jgi:hypothetical protein
VVAGVLVVVDFLAVVVETLMVVVVLVDFCVVVLDSSVVVLDSSVVVLDSSVFEFAGSAMADVNADSSSIAAIVRAENVALVDVSFFSGIFAGAYTDFGGAIARVFVG